MKFTEHDSNLELGSLPDFLKSITSMTILAPFRLLHELSTKVIFIKKELIEKSLIMSTVVGIVFICSDLISSLFISYQGTFLTSDLLLYATATAILAIVTIVYKNTNFMLYDQLNRMFPNPNQTESTVDESMKPINTKKQSIKESVKRNITAKEKAPIVTLAKEEAENTTEFVDEAPVIDKDEVKDLPDEQDFINEVEEAAESLVQSVQNTDAEQSEDIGQVTKHAEQVVEKPKSNEPDEILDFVNRYKNKVNILEMSSSAYCGALSETEIENFSKDMQSCTDPSRFISDDLLQMFSQTSKDEDLSFLSELDLSIIPDSFTF